jgi:hypothetical protein
MVHRWEKYGFLQPFTRHLAKYQGKTFSLKLTTNYRQHTFFVATIRKIYVPDDSELAEAYRRFKAPASCLSSVLARNRTWSTSFASSRANPAHSEDKLFGLQYPAGESNLVRQFRGLPCFHHTRRATIKCPDLDSNQDHDLRRVGCDPLHHQDRFFSPEPTTGVAPASTGLQDRCLAVRPRRQKQDREESNPVKRLWRPPALPGARSCKADPSCRAWIGALWLPLSGVQHSSKLR